MQPAVPAIVIAHGAWVGATGWREAIALLQAKGLRVVAVHLPLSSLAEDVNTVRRVIERQTAPVVLVGHGYGGTVITEAGIHPRVGALVYVTALVPDIGESTTSPTMEYPPHACVPRLKVDAAGYLYLTDDAVAEFLAQDLPAAEGSVLAAAQQPIRASALLESVTAAAWHTKPCWYALADQDRMIPPTSQRVQADRAQASVSTIGAGHTPFLSKPMETVEVILAAVASVARTTLVRGAVVGSDALK